LLGTRYAPLIVDLCTRLAELIKARTLSGVDATALITTAIEILRHNPALFSSAKGNLSIVVVDATLLAAGNDPSLSLNGSTFVDTVRAILISVARHGAPRLAPLARDAATEMLAEIIRDALKQASAELGRRLDVPGLPIVIGGLVAAWARGDLVKVDPASPACRELLVSLTLVATTPAVTRLS
jgi:hypothetical protein